MYEFENGDKVKVLFNNGELLIEKTGVIFLIDGTKMWLEENGDIFTKIYLSDIVRINKEVTDEA